MADQNLHVPDPKQELLTAGKRKEQQNVSASIVIDMIIRIAALGLLLFWCFRILEPFISVVVWAVVLAVAVYPVFKSVRKLFRGKNGLAATLLPVIMLSILVVPAVWMMIATGSELKSFGEQVREGNISVPPPNESVKNFPLIGYKVYEIWTGAATNLQELVVQFRDQIKSLLATLIAMIASTGKGLLLLSISIIISGFFLANAIGAGNFARSIFVRIAGVKGSEMTDVAELTIRNVTRGILGVAFIQSILAGTGMFIGGVPLAGLWTLVCLVLAIVQIGILPVSIGVIIYAWSAAPTLTATLLTIWMLVVGIMDNILKPIMLGKGAPVPMLVVFLGAIGGFIYSGFIGLFTGAIVLSLAYKLFIVWLEQKETEV